MTLRSFRVFPSAVRASIQPTQLKVALQPLAARATRECQQVADERLDSHTGRYRSGFRSHVETDAGGQIIARIVTENAVPYAGYIERGTRPHIIRARGRALRFVANGETVFRRAVFHPGTTAYRVIEVALKRIARRA